MNILIPINKSDYGIKNLSDILGEFFQQVKQHMDFAVMIQ